MKLGVSAWMRAWFAIPFWQRVLAGFVLGALAGWLFGEDAKTCSSLWAMSTSISSR